MLYLFKRCYSAEICTYSRVLCGKEGVYRHLLELVKRQYMFEQDIRRHPSDVPPIPVEMVAQAFRDYRVCYIVEDQWGQRTEQPWHHVPGHMAWYTRVFLLNILLPKDGSPPRPANREQLIEDEHVREKPDTLELIKDCVRIADEALARSDELSIAELRQVLGQISNTGCLALNYHIARQRRGHGKPRHQS